MVDAPPKPLRRPAAPIDDDEVEVVRRPRKRRRKATNFFSARTVTSAVVLIVFGLMAIRFGIGLSNFAKREFEKDQQNNPYVLKAEWREDQSANSVPSGPSFAEARKDFQTKLIRSDRETTRVPIPPAGLFRFIRYSSPAGQMAAYLSVDPKDGKKHPAMLWVTGGFSNGIGESAWEDAPAANDQSASAFRKAGMVMMYPSFRGGEENPGQKESLFGEVDDLLAAADELAKQDFVDPSRIYLGGHSTGGTLALLAAAASGTKFRAVFSFGPVEDVAGYGQQNVVFDVGDPRERRMRAPIKWLSWIRTPTYVIEGGGGNYGSLLALQQASRNPNLHYLTAWGFDHFSILAPATRVIAERIMQDDGPSAKIRLDQGDFDRMRGR